MSIRPSNNKTLPVALGGIIWLLALWFAGASVYRVYARSTRPSIELRVALPSDGAIAPRPGDGVFAATDVGLVRIGEVSRTDLASSTTTLTVMQRHTDLINVSTIAEFWRTPLSMEHAVSVLLPPELQRRIVAEVEAGWDAHEDEIVAAWKPIATELSSSFVELIADDLRQALQDREDELLEVAQKHAAAFGREWPDIQARLAPILEENLTPVLGRLLSDAVDEAPKTRIAWAVARGRNEEAFQIMLDWLNEYLGSMPEQDRAEFREALRKTWQRAKSDRVLTERFSRLGRNLRDDPRLQEILLEVYHDAISDNPQTTAFVNERIVESLEVQRAFYRFLELFGPTAREVTSLILFDHGGTTRPEIVFLVRSIAVGRRVTWVTLRTLDPTARSIEPGATVPTYAGGGLQ